MTRLRRSCTAIDPQLLNEELEETLADLRKTREVAILVSPGVEVPTALGFRRPAVVIPAWLAEDITAAELRYIVLHELEHLRRHDDWTNLVQKLVKAVLFFHPGVWWIERRLSLEREMACDDAVLLQTSAARVYARCLARVAEKRLSRRQMTLAQAAVDRLHQLSLRVMNILAEAPGRDRTARLWKPAIPMVTAFTLLCALSVSQAPELVGVIDTPNPAIAAASLSPSSSAAPVSAGKGVSATTSARAGASEVQIRPQWPAASFVPARYTLPQPEQRKRKPVHRQHAAARPVEIPQIPVRVLATSFTPPSSAKDATNAASLIDERSGQIVFLFISSQQMTTTSAGTWQVRALEVLWFVPENRPAKQIPKKI